ncbi:hypothetical protein Btru_032967 [Bulinus truncatus]|nr:hypothetical protein Btru_032967 [Bulinus truncatus]
MMLAHTSLLQLTKIDPHHQIQRPVLFSAPDNQIQRPVLFSAPDIVYNILLLNSTSDDCYLTLGYTGGGGAMWRRAPPLVGCGECGEGLPQWWVVVNVERRCPNSGLWSRGYHQNHTHPNDVDNHTHPNDVDNHTHPNDVDHHTHPNDVDHHTHPNDVDHHTHPNDVDHHTHPNDVDHHTHPNDVDHHTHPNDVDHHTHPNDVDHKPSLYWGHGEHLMGHSLITYLIIQQSHCGCAAYGWSKGHVKAPSLEGITRVRPRPKK